MLAMIGSAVALRNLTRTDFIREALQRNLTFFNEHEDTVLARLQDKFKLKKPCAF